MTSVSRTIIPRPWDIFERERSGPDVTPICPHAISGKSQYSWNWIMELVPARLSDFQQGFSSIMLPRYTNFQKKCQSRQKNMWRIMGSTQDMVHLSVALAEIVKWQYGDFGLPHRAEMLSWLWKCACTQVLPWPYSVSWLLPGAWQLELILHKTVPHLQKTKGWNFRSHSVAIN